MTSKRVIPLESNPEIFNNLSYNLGLSPILQFHDLYSITDKELLNFVPQPIYGVILLFPITENYERYRKETDGNFNYKNEKIADIKWFKQTIGNACGLYALLHVLGNLPNDLIISSSQLNDLLRQVTYHSSIEDMARLVENLESEIKLDSNYGSQGQTEAPSAETQVNLHFVSYVKGRDNHIYELDGRRNGPIDLGEHEPVNILDSDKLVDKIQFYMNNADDENKHNFSIIALGPSFT